MEERKTFSFPPLLTLEEEKKVHEKLPLFPPPLPLFHLLLLSGGENGVGGLFNLIWESRVRHQRSRKTFFCIILARKSCSNSNRTPPQVSLLKSEQQRSIQNPGGGKGGASVVGVFFFGRILVGNGFDYFSHKKESFFLFFFLSAHALFFSGKRELKKTGEIHVWMRAYT